ncbi:acyl transferase/acyl hydrolase/lysophospholipase [Auriculariales sp. MPI-PUGE-AT-0066]|nr:acyl transferase/acyl hydrolase/lysophospholipase [Auriculariales sp. MPI-PUGE-AT-0066]
MNRVMTLSRRTTRSSTASWLSTASLSTAATSFVDEQPVLASTATSTPSRTVMSIDAGGILGVHALVVFETLDAAVKEEELARGLPSRPLSSYFDQVAGTSAGSLVSVLLACAPVDRMVDMWASRAWAHGVNILVRKASTRKLRNQLAVALNDLGLGSDATMADLGARRNTPNVSIVVTSAREAGVPIVVSSRSSEMRDGAPSFFKPTPLAFDRNSASPLTPCVDGALAAANPTAALRLKPQETALVISIGLSSGTKRGADLGAKPTVTNLFLWLKGFGRIIVDPERIHEEMQTHFEWAERPESYVRIPAPDIYDRAELDEFDKIPELVAASRAMFKDPEWAHKIRRLAERVVAIKFAQPSKAPPASG